MGTSSPLSSPPTSDGSPAVPSDKSRPIVRSSRGPPVVLVPPPSLPTGEEKSPPGAKAAEESQGGLQPESEAASAAFEGKAVDASAGAVNSICSGEQAAISFGDGNPNIADVSPAGNVPDPAPLELDGQTDVVMDESHTSAAGAGPSPPTLPTDSSVPNLEAALLPPNELEPAASSFTEIDPYAHLESPPSIATGTAADKSDDLQIDRVNEVAMENSELVRQLEPSRTPIEAATPKSEPGGEYNDLLAGLDDADFDFQLSSPMKPEASSLSFPESGPDDDDDDRIIPSSQEDERPLTMLSFATANRSAASQDLDEQTPLAKRRKLATDGREIERPPPPTFNLGMTTSVAGASTAQGDGRRFTRVDSKKLMPPPNSKPSRSVSPDSFDAPSSSSSSSILPSSSLDLANQPFKGVFSTGMGKTFKAPSKTALLAAAKLMEVDPSDMDFDDLFSDGNDFSGFGRVETPQPKASSQTLRPRSVPAPAQKVTVASQAPSSKEAAAAAGSPLTPQLSCTNSISDAPLPPIPVSQHPSQTKTTPAAVASTPHPPLAPVLLSSSTPRRPVSQFSDTAIRPPPFRALSFSSASRPSQPSPSGSGSSSIVNGTPSRTKSTAPRTGLASTPLRTPLLSRSNTPSGSSSSTAPSAATAAPTATPLRRIGVGNLGMTPRGRGGGGPGSGRKKFSTPFKGGVKPPVDDDGRVVSATTATPGSSTRLAAGVTGPQQHLPPRSAMMSSVKGKERETPRYDKVFDLTPPGKRVSMRDSFVRPEFYSISELRDMLIPEEIWQINPQNAHLFSFVHPTDPSISLGPELALATLVDAGCQGLTRTWVDNHWALILWKLASLVRSKPAWYMENTWNWEATIRQLKYRYEREHNLGHRSAVKRIQEGDTAPGSSMILCVTAITMIPVEAPFAVNSAGGAGGGGEDVPTLELTDGWYRIRSAIDTVLSRAVTRGKLRVGCKIAIFGARLEGEPGSPVLRAYEKTTLVLSGNGTSLARWDAKLGLQALPFVAGLSSLSPEGGVVPRMDIVVERCFPLGWIDTPAEVAGGPPAGKTEPSKESVGVCGPGTAAEPSIRRGEKEELIEREKWAENHDAVKSSLLESIERRLELLLSLAERVERMASSSSLTEAAASFDPDDIIDIVLGLPTSAAQTDDLRGRTLSMAQLKQLASTVKERYREDQAGIETEIEREMAIRCPPRESRSFRLIWFRDFHQRPSLVGSTTSDAKLPRRGQLTLWDAAGGEDGLDGGFGGMDGVGGLVEGKRYIVSNLTPGQRSSWSPAGMTGGEVYLNTRRDSRWRCIG